MNNKKSVITLLFLLTMNFATVSAQENLKITGTNLTVELKEGFVSDEDSPTISNNEYCIIFIETPGVSFFDQLKNFSNIDEKYASKGIKVLSNERGKLSDYEALFLKIDTPQNLHQIFFGNDEFCAIANIQSLDSSKEVHIEEAKLILSTIEYEQAKSPLEEHANFELSENLKDWILESYAVNTFVFSNNNNEEVGSLILQLPGEIFSLQSKKEIAEELKVSLETEIPNLRVIEDGIWVRANKEGYRLILNAEGSEKNSSLIYIYVFGNEDYGYVFQGVSQINDLISKQLFEEFIEELEVK